MQKRGLKVVIYPEQSGEHPLVEPHDVKRIIKMDQYEELSVSLCNVATSTKIVPVVSNAIKKGQKVDIVFWNPLPESELKKLLRYDLEKINGISLSSINHNLKDEIIHNPEKREMSEIEKTEKKWEDFWEKRKVKSH